MPATLYVARYSADPFQFQSLRRQLVSRVRAGLLEPPRVIETVKNPVPDPR